MEGFSVYFTTVPHLLTQIRDAKTDNTLQLLERRFRKYDLILYNPMHIPLREYIGCMEVPSPLFLYFSK